ncbi:FAD-dependent oxidoreductase [Candidatus Bipolaricaulota bacterium]|nr:FAD-dependent oxidoreductase [Candidatus Bipolaricaulota bacterium]
MTLSDGSKRPDVWDVLIVGGGPAGASAALYAARSKLMTLVVDKGIASGALGMAQRISNYPGVNEELPGEELIGRMREQARAVGARFEQDKVIAVSLDGNGDTKRVRGTRGAYEARSLILATGALGRSHTVPGEERLLGRGVSYCATCDGFFFTDRDVVVAGNSEEAAEEALFLTRYAAHVFLLSPTPELRVPDVLQRRVRENPAIELRSEHRLLEVVGDNDVAAVRVAAPEGEMEQPVAGVFIYAQGNRPVTDYLTGQLETTDSGCLSVDEFFQTNIPGVFAAGDVLCKHFKQIVIASAEGAMAAMAAERFLSGRETLRPDWAK